MARRADLHIAVIRKAVSDLAWEAREVGQPLPSEGDRPAFIAGSPALLRWLCRCYLLGFRLRYDYRFEALEISARGWRRSGLNDALLLAFASFAGLGRGSKSALRDVERALTSENVDPTTRYVCLQALWFADHLADQAERMIELSDQILDLGDDSPNL